MIYTPSILAVILFCVFVGTVIGISIFFARQSRSSKGFFAAGGTIKWPVNGIAFAGDYLSAASFLGICGMIAVSGYDGFLYSIGYLAGWVVALLVVAEPLRRLGRYTFADALDAKFQYKGIRLIAGISALVVSIFYLIPQMVGAGALVTPLLGLPHAVGVLVVGGIVIFIVATSGMKSTTYVQFLKGGLLIIFSFVLTIAILNRGIGSPPSEDYHEFATIAATVSGDDITLVDSDGTVLDRVDTAGGTFVKTRIDGIDRWWRLEGSGSSATLAETLSVTQVGGQTLYNGQPQAAGAFYPVGHAINISVDGQRTSRTGPLGPFTYIATIQESDVVRFEPASFSAGDESVTVWYQVVTPGERVMRPGLKFHVDEGSSVASRLNFVSLMIALFFGTAALPHVLIRYYTVPRPSDARKSTIVAIAAIGFFYILTLYIGLGAMTSGVLDVTSSNMSAPLLAKSFGVFLFSMISAIAFATVLGTVSGLIVAASGAVAHDLTDSLVKKEIDGPTKVLIGRIAAVVVGVIAIILGILFKGMNVSFLVGWAFSIAASANFPSIIMMLFWKRTTGKGIVASVLVGMVASVTIILLSPSMWERYGLVAANAPIPLDNPAIISIPLSFIALVVVSLGTQSTLKPAVGSVQ